MSETDKPQMQGAEDGARLAELRAQVDAIDSQLVELLNARARIAQQIGHVKGGTAVYRPEREAQVIDRVVAASAGPLGAKHLRPVFVEIMGACRSLEAPIAVAFLGPAGTYSEEAVVRQFGGLAERRPCASFDDVFREVESGRTPFGLVPVENSTEGAVGRTLDLLLATTAPVTGEVLLPVHHNLMSSAGSIAAITRLYSHAQSLGQCVHWLNAHLAGVERVAVASNAEAARLAASEPGAAAIAGRAAAARYGLALLAENIEDEPDNTTRFLVIGGTPPAPSGRDKTSLVLAARNQPGAVHALLAPLAANGVSMTRFESRPARTGRWEYLFFIDIEGHPGEPHVARALAELEERALFLKRLGSYPAAREQDGAFR